MTVPPYKTAQVLFEEHKNDKRVQAILKQLGRLQEHVSDWSITTSPEEITYRVVFTDGKEMRGLILQAPQEYDWQKCEWIATGKIIPADVAQNLS